MVAARVEARVAVLAAVVVVQLVIRLSVLAAAVVRMRTVEVHGGVALVGGDVGEEEEG